MDESKVKKPSVALFAEFFKGYGIALGVILAAIPLVSRGLDLLPVYSANKSVLTFFTSLLSLLAVALLFSVRRRIGSVVFPPGRRVLSPKELWARRLCGVLVPSVLVCVSAISLMVYLESLDRSVDQVALDFSHVRGVDENETLRDVLEHRQKATGWLFNETSESARVAGTAETRESGGTEKRMKAVRFGSEEGVNIVLNMTPSTDIAYRWVMELSYVMMFLCAAIAFVWLGLIEYMQGVLELDDKDILANPYRPASDHVFKIKDIVDLDPNPAPVFFTLGYSPEDDPPRLVHGPHGPFCLAHRNELEYAGTDEQGRHIWNCTVVRDDKSELLHTITLRGDRVDLDRHMRRSAYKELDHLSGRIRVSS